jgi:hypothetical protein
MKYHDLELDMIITNYRSRKNNARKQKGQVVAKRK